MSVARLSSWCALALAVVLFAMVLTPRALAATAERTPGVTVTEQRIALVIGNAAYKSVGALDNPVNDARLIARSLGRAGFDVLLKEDLDRNGMVAAMREFGARLNENTIALLYYAGHGLQLRDRNFLIPVDAEIRSEDEIPLAGVDLGFLLGRMSAAKSRINIVIVDACRDNPFAGRAGSTAAQGLAQMDAPLGTLVAYATAPGKLSADGGVGNNGFYAAHLARHLLTPGLPVEHVFKRVREGVVRDTRDLSVQQVPWEHSSLQGEFAFVPGVAAPREAVADVEAAGELAFWSSIESANRADEYRAYLRQYPNGRFAALAQTRIAGFAPAPAPGAPTAVAAQAAPSPASALPRPGDTWRYRVQDQFRLGDLFLTAKVDAVNADGIAETWSTTSDASLRTTLAALAPAFHALPGWTLTPPEFSPYLEAAGGLRRGVALAGLSRRIGAVTVPLRASIEGEEEVEVAAGRFRAVKVVLRGHTGTRGAAAPGAVSTEQVVWYAPAVKRMVKTTVSTRVGQSISEGTTFELTEFKLN
jgi:uncharacterized caspase-like protein